MAKELSISIKSINDISIFEQNNRDYVILTPNTRLCGFIKQQINKKLSSNNKVYKSPNVLPLQAWLVQTYQNNNTIYENKQSYLLSNYQEQSIWEKILKNNSSSPFFSVSQTAQMLGKTQNLINQWNVLKTDMDNIPSEETQFFNSCASKFHSYCKDNNFIGASSLTNILIDLIKENKVALPKTIIFACFDEFIPSIVNLINTLVDTKHSVIRYEPSPLKSIAYLHKANNIQDELIDMILWARKKHFEGNKSICCVIPNLKEIRQPLQKLVHKYLTEIQPEVTFNISAGIMLDNYLIIKNIFAILELKENLTIQNITKLLASSYISSAQLEHITRSHLNKTINSLGIDDITMDEFINLANDKKYGYCPKLIESINDFFKLKTTLSSYPPSQWAGLFSQLLLTFGWPGDLTLNSEEYQLVEKWKLLLTSFATCDYIYDNLSYDEALFLLKSMISQTEFQIKSTQKDIQFLGTLEASGLTFDCIWANNLTNDNWPISPTPNPFIPIDIQKRYNLPHSSYKREYQFSQKVTDRLNKSCKEIIFSYAQHNKDIEQAPSPIIKDFDILPYAIEHIKSIQESLFLDQQLDKYSDDIAPPYNKTETITGGSEIISNQATCPFKAFAKNRLNIKTDFEPHYGIGFKEKGILIHKILELFWSNTLSSSKLDQMSEPEIIQLIEVCTKNAIKSQLPNIFQAKHKELLKLEQETLSKVILEWIQYEKARNPFTCYAIEQKHEYSHKDLKINLRLDRIDQLDRNNYYIIDYKSTMPVGIDWYSDRPDVSQLILYSISESLPITGLLYAQIKPGNFRFKGICKDNKVFIHQRDTSIEDSSIEWEKLKDKWKHTVSNMLDDFTNGMAKVDPKKGNMSCNRCMLHALCRINELES